MVNIMEIKDALKTIVTTDSERLGLKTNALAPVEKNAAVTSASKSAELKAIESLVGSSVPFDSAKVAAIKAAIVDGSYKTNPGDAADGIIMSTQDFLTTDLSETKFL